MEIEIRRVQEERISKGMSNINIGDKEEVKGGLNLKLLSDSLSSVMYQV